MVWNPLPWIGRVYALTHKVEQLLELQTTTRQALEAIDKRLRTLEDRMTYIEANESKIITEAKAAASTAASAAATIIASGAISDAANRIARLEAGAENPPKRLPPA